ncbi:conserved exported hypothetical protein [Cupriavidus necator]|uniref:Uncharacterized protein n=1 Tax=Cupriavidus necator TaxID=106590 RepID=A0A1K0IBP8_CUPNE|nr:conserved exported hypothetical protein [Cupriavidus necator]
MRHLSLWLVLLALPIQNVGAAATLSCAELQQGLGAYAVLDAAEEASADDTDAPCDTASHHCLASKERGKARGCHACAACTAASPLAIAVFWSTQALPTTGMPLIASSMAFSSTTPETLLRPPSRHL